MLVFKGKNILAATPVALALALGVAAPGIAQEAADGPALSRKTPRESVVGYLEAGIAGDWERAARYLNLDPVPASARDERGPVLARHLKTVLDRTLWVDPALLSDDPAGHRDDGLPPLRDRVGAIDTASGRVEVFVDRRSANGAPVWQISASTVARIPALYEEFGDGLLGEVLPPVFFASRILQVELWQWIGLLLLVLAAYLVSWYLARACVSVVRPLVARSRTEVDDHLFDAALGPLRLLFAVAIFALALPSLGLSVPAHRFFVKAEQVAGVIVVTWFTMRAIDVLGGVMGSRLEANGQRAASTLVPLGTRTVKVVVVGLALLASLDSLGFDVTALIAGLGVGGLAVALAAQKTVENLFGGATLIADRPVQVGDFCRFGDRVGTVEQIGLRSTRVRTLDRTVVTVPNAEFSTIQLENFAARDRIWFHPTIGLRYETTPDQLRYVLVEVRRMLYAHPRVDPDPARVRFAGFGDFSLNLDLFVYVRATDYSEYLEIAEDLNLRIMDIVAASGTGFAFPSNTTYLAQDGGLDPERSREAEEQVRRWREGRELALPGFSRQQIDALRGSLDYPPRGSVLRSDPDPPAGTRIGEE